MRVLVCSLLACLLAQVASAQFMRERQKFDFDWRFHLGSASDVKADFEFGTGGFAKAGSAPGAAGVKFDDSSWRKLDLPHDWVVEQDFVPGGDFNHLAHGFKPASRNYPDKCVGWYRKAFDIPKGDLGKRISLEFDGVFRDCTVWLNGHLVGKNQSGYIGFRCDITDYVDYGRTNVLSVRVDASQYEGWFYEGAGIYRHVWLVKTPPVHVPQWGTYVVASPSGQIVVQTEVANESDQRATTSLRSRVTDDRGTVVGEVTTDKVSLEPWTTKTVTQKLRVSSIKLWSPESPNLYKLESRLASGQDEDRYETTFGSRSMRFDADKGFFLNGKHTWIKGTCNHQDHAGVGAAVPDAVNVYRIQRLRTFSNALRTSHNPPTPELLDACDRLGMMVMDENRLLDSSPEGISQLERLIRRDRNHPSVVFWSIGNEEGWVQSWERGEHIAKTLVRTVKALDPTRPVTYAADNGPIWTGINSVVDVRGVNYYRPHWNPPGNIDKYHAEHPKQPIMGSEEASALSTRGEYANDKAQGYVQAYDTERPGWGETSQEWLQYYMARPWLAGGFVWTGFDYRGEPTPYEWPCISSHFGILDTCGFPKDNYFYYLANWTDQDVVHLLPHWNWEGKEGQPIEVWCYANTDEVELFLNDRSLGKQKVDKLSHLEWKVPYVPGALEARGYRGGKLVKTDRRETAGKAAKILLSADRTSIAADGQDVSVVTVSVVDANGRLVPGADDDIQFEVDSGQILGVGNGNPGSHERDRFVDTPQRANRKVFHGLAQAIVGARKSKGEIELKAHGAGLEDASLKLEVR